jgi:hypothetical protein
MTRRTRGNSLPQVIEDLAPYLLGWRGYFGFCQTPRVLTHLEAWIRRRLRAYLWRGRGGAARCPPIPINPQYCLRRGDQTGQCGSSPPPKIAAGWRRISLTTCSAGSFTGPDPVPSALLQWLRWARNPPYLNPPFLSHRCWCLTVFDCSTKAGLRASRRQPASRRVSPIMRGQQRREATRRHPTSSARRRAKRLLRALPRVQTQINSAPRAPLLR